MGKKYKCKEKHKFSKSLHMRAPFLNRCVNFPSFFIGFVIFKLARLVFRKAIQKRKGNQLLAYDTTAVDGKGKRISIKELEGL